MTFVDIHQATAAYKEDEWPPYHKTNENELPNPSERFAKHIRLIGARWFQQDHLRFRRLFAPSGLVSRLSLALLAN
jgi:hypothetical protein